MEQKLSTYYELAAPQCSAEEFDGEIVAINLDSGIYFSMKAPASWIFLDLSAGHSLETVLSFFNTETNLYSATEKFISEVISAGLLRQRSVSSTPETPPQLASVPTTDLASPLLESFGDMQSLLLLDPVHDVDEKLGWPVVSPSGSEKS